MQQIQALLCASVMKHFAVIGELLVMVMGLQATHSPAATTEESQGVWDIPIAIELIEKWMLLKII